MKIISASIIVSFIVLTFSLRVKKNTTRPKVEKNYKQHAIAKTESCYKKRLPVERVVVDPLTLSEELQIIFGLREESYRNRLRTIFKLSSDLSIHDRQALYQFLRSDENDAKALHLKDEVMRKLERQNVRPPELEQVLIDIMQDKSVDGDLRGYIVQHLRTAYGVPEVDKELVQEGLYLAVEDIQSDVSGTAILALVNLAKDNPDAFDTELIRNSAIDLTTDKSTQVGSKLTAIECCAQLGLTEVLPTARSIVSSPDEPIAHKLPAIRAIGLVGGKDDLVLLQKMPKKKYMQKAIDSAINIINSKK